MSLFYVPLLSEQDSHVDLPEEEAFHAIKVLRLKTGDILELTNGNGLWAKANIDFIDKKHISLSIVEKKISADRHTFQLSIAVAPTKNQERIEWFIEKAVEIGIDAVYILQTQNSERKKVNFGRLQKTAIAAMKQSQQSFLPKIEDGILFQEFIKEQNFEQKFIAHCQKNNLPSLVKLAQKQKKTVVLIGPEGDFSPTEITLALSKNYQEISLSNNRLRTETAALQVCAILDCINQV